MLIAAYIFVLHRQTTYDWVEGFANPFCNPLILVFAIFAGQRNRGAIKLQSSLAAGEPHHQPTDWQAPHLRQEASAVSGLDARDNCIHLPAVSAQCILFFRPTDCRGKAAPADDFSGGTGKRS